jgi:membrane associated rhomboid family serine protease
MSSRPMSVRLVLWTPCMAYVGFLLAGARNAAPPSIAITAAFLGAMIGFALGIMFANRAHRRHTQH